MLSPTTWCARADWAAGSMGVSALKFFLSLCLTSVNNQLIMTKDTNMAPYSLAFVQVSNSAISDKTVFFMQSQNFVTHRALLLPFAALDLAAGLGTMPIYNHLSSPLSLLRRDCLGNVEVVDSP